MTSAASSSLAGDVADRAVVAVEGPHRGRPAAGDERTAGQAVEDVADGLVVEGAVERAADDAARA